MWIWIGGGIIAGVIVFIAAFSMLSQTTNAISEQQGTAPYDQLKNLVENDLCFSTSGNQRTLDVALSESILAIYASSDKTSNLSDSDYSNKILAAENSEGTYLCMKRKDRRLECGEMTCLVKMPFIGAVPEEQSLSALISRVLGNHKTFEYNLVLTKEPNYISIKT